MSDPTNGTIINPQTAWGAGNDSTTENNDSDFVEKANQMGTAPSNLLEKLNASPDNTPQLDSTPEDRLEKSSTSPKNNSAQANVRSGTTTSQIKSSSCQIENQRINSASDNAEADNTDTRLHGIVIPQMETSESENNAELTTTHEPSSTEQNHFQFPTIEDNPYAMTKDPFGHYANAKRRILGIDSPRSDATRGIQPTSTRQIPEELKVEQSFRKRFPDPTDEQIMEAVSRTLAKKRYQKPRIMQNLSHSVPHAYVPGMGSGPFTPINSRSDTFEHNEPNYPPHHAETTRSCFDGEGEMASEDEVSTPLEKPIVLGRIVQRKRKRSHALHNNNNDECVETKRLKSNQKRFGWEDFDESRGLERGQPNLPFHQVEKDHEGEARDNTHDEHGHNIYAPSRFRAPGAAPANPFGNGHNSGKGERHISDNGFIDDSEHELFVSGRQKRHSSNSGQPAHYDPHNESRRHLGHGINRQTSRTRSGQKGYFNVFGQRLEPSRYSGTPMPWDVSVDPEMVDQSQVSDASLLKRDIARGSGKTICKRSYGASDPENIAIVNMKEFEHLSFDQIAKILNEKRVMKGKVPSLSAVGVNSRYNRTAPLLFSAQGKEFIPLSKRKGKGREIFDADKDGALEWNDELDIALVTSVKEVDAARWNTVALLFEEKTGKKLSASAAAVRHNLL